ncbi:hypothetical protein FN976_05460 [Caenimonas sedimenti]|uniref:Uncharacterized protein n=1 Tax=Caenimonas sedimenti TaxID=2596921 RepID=A0A562ZUV7_9BURK|nr:hypothetical protein [Caenimonas sedimenti]TWO72161.1 hypothetical protein FN976_05460 [Caenimonas sedimenti]
MESIRQKRRLRLEYHGKAPDGTFMLRVGHKDNELLRVHQLAGGTEPEPLFNVSKIEGLVVLEEGVVKPGPNDKKGDCAMKKIFCEL